MAAVYAVFGERLAAWLANPLFGVAVFFIAKWDGANRQHNKDWWEYLRFPGVKIWKVLAIIATIFLVQFVAGFITERYVEAYHPELADEDFVESLYGMLNVSDSAIIFMSGMVLSFFCGGYVAGKLCPYKFMRPYTHAAFGEGIFYLVSVVTMEFIFICKCGTPPTQEDIGWHVALAPPWLLLSLFGVWVATNTKVFHRLDMIGRSIRTTGHRLSRGKR